MSRKNSPYCNPIIEKICSEWYEMDLTNKILLFLGTVLLFELIFSIFMRSVDTDVTTDAFFRITFSSVLGYFLGCMNTNSAHLEKEKISNPAPPVVPIEQVASKPPDSPLPVEQDFEHLTSIRTLFVAFVCFACIITLSVTTFINQTEYAEGLIQLRNIISTTIGFLISKANRRR